MQKGAFSPADSCRRTLAVMGGVSLGTRLEDAGEGGGDGQMDCLIGPKNVC